MSTPNFLKLFNAVAAEWGTINPPAINLNGNKVALIHYTGKSVGFELSRLDLTQDQVALQAVIAQPLAELKQSLGG